MPSQHGCLPRGMAAAGTNPGLLGAKFGRLFPKLPAGCYGASDEFQQKNLEALAEAMVSSFDAPKDGVDSEESSIPALYTYFGQFIDHDLTFDPNSSFIKVKDPNALVDFRTPAFDLDNLYGRGPTDQPYMFEDDNKTLLLGDELSLGSPGARDLQRNSAGRALIGDPRNDENVIVSQLHGLMIRFHNEQVKKNRDLAFEDVQAIVRHHYQYIIVNDFLDRIVNANVLEELKTHGRFDRRKIKFFKNFAPPTELPYMPLEFSVAAYRLGHSMVRSGYRLNDSTLLPIFPLPSKSQPGFPEGLTGFRRVVSNWGIDWGRFIDVDIRDYGSDNITLDAEHTDVNFKRLQFAYRIDTALVDPLRHLPKSVGGDPPKSLALLNLKRGVSFGLPTGQEVARAMGIDPLHDDQILIGQGVDKDDGPKLTKISAIANGAFNGKCPLWTYILAEAMQNKPRQKIPVLQEKTISTPQLGPVGGRIVAEVFLGLLFADPGSYLNLPYDWTPGGNPNYKLKDLVADALGLSPGLPN